MRYSNDNERYMAEALRQAKKAAMIEEVPIGCVIVHENKIIARGYNRKKEEALRIIRECENNGVKLTEEQKIELFKNVINR